MTAQRPDIDRRALKTASRLLVSDLGGVDAFSSCTRATRSMASEYGNPASDRFIPVDVLLDAETIAGTPHVTATLARLLGYALIPVEPRAAGDLSVALAEIGRDVAALFATAALALAHGAPTEQERQELQRELSEVGRVVAEASQLLGTPRQVAGEPRAPSIPRGL